MICNIGDYFVAPLNSVSEEEAANFSLFNFYYVYRATGCVRELKAVCFNNLS